MNTMQFSYKDTCGISTDKLNETLSVLPAEISRIRDAQKDSYATRYASINVLYDTHLIDTVEAVVAEKRKLNPTLIILIGIGGSNLGTIAIIEAIYGTLYNTHNPVQFYCADTVDTDTLSRISVLIEKEFSCGNNIIMNVISKSGTTTETIANFQLLLELLKKHRPYNYHHFVVVTTDTHSPLWYFGKQQEMAVLDIPKNIGGRYSVFSAVGLFPLALYGIDIVKLHAGALYALEQCLSMDIMNNPAAISAAILYELYQQNFLVHDTFLFSPDLESVGKWYRQLMAESIGKAYDTSGALVNNGILPTVSIGSTDLHSVAQLYLSGPHIIFTTFISVEKSSTDLELGHNQELATIAPTIQNKSMLTIMDAILQGTMAAYYKDKRPFAHIIVPEKNEFYIGQCMQQKMIEIMYLGFLMNINPFDQPNVELYKQETKMLLEGNFNK